MRGFVLLAVMELVLCCRENMLMLGIGRYRSVGSYCALVLAALRDRNVKPG